MTVPPPCQGIASTLDSLYKQKQSLSKELSHAAPGEKHVITNEIKQINQLIKQEQQKLADCIKNNPQAPPADSEAFKRCKSLLNGVTLLQKEMQRIAEELHHAAPGQKPGLVRQINDLRKKIDKKKKEFDRCMIQHGGLPDLTTTLTGRATITTDHKDASGPFNRRMTATIVFRKFDHTKVTANLNPLTFGPIDTPVGDVTITITQVGGIFGTFDPKTGALYLNMKLYVENDSDVAGNSYLELYLGTNDIGAAPVDSAGKVTLVGAGTFNEGYLDGNNCWLRIAGTISPNPLQS